MLVAIAATAAGLIVSGAIDGLRDRGEVEEFLTESGAWGPLLFVLAFVAAQPLSLPGAALIIPATFVWPWYEVFVYSIAGGVVASSVGFATARWIGHDWVQDRLPPRLERWDTRLAERGFPAVVGLRILTGYAPPADWLLGVSDIRWRPFLAGTLVGLMPMTLLMAIFGDDAVRSIGDAPVWATGVALAVLGAAAVVLAWRARGRAAGGVSRPPTAGES